MFFLNNTRASNKVHGRGACTSQSVFAKRLWIFLYLNKDFKVLGHLCHYIFTLPQLTFFVYIHFAIDTNTDSYIYELLITNWLISINDLVKYKIDHLILSWEFNLFFLLGKSDKSSRPLMLRVCEIVQNNRLCHIFVVVFLSMSLKEKSQFKNSEPNQYLKKLRLGIFLPLYQVLF